MGTCGTATGGKLTCAPWLAAALAVALGVAAPAGAEFYEFTFGGEIHTVDGIVPEPWDTVHVGSEFEYTYIFDSEAEDQSGIPWYGVYDLIEVQITIEGIVQATEEGKIFVENGGLDIYTVSFSDLPIGGAQGNVKIIGDDDVIDSDDLLLDIDLDAWVHGKQLEMGGQGWVIRGHIFSFEGKIVPAPGSLMIVIFGGLLIRRRRQA